MKITDVLTILAIPAILLAIPIFLIFKAKMESQTYNKLTGAHTTTWDAIWVELRVQDTPTTTR